MKRRALLGALAVGGTAGCLRLEGGGGDETSATRTATAATESVETTTATRVAAETAGSSVSPGLAFLLGGALILAAGFAYWYTANR